MLSQYNLLQHYRRFRQWYRRFQMLRRMNELPGQMKLETVYAPDELASRILLGDRTVFELTVEAHGHSRVWKVVLLDEPNDTWDVIRDREVHVIRIMDGLLWPQFQKTVFGDQLCPTGHGVMVAVEQKLPAHLLPVR